MPEDLRPPYRIQFDNARDPYTARNALGITSLGGLITSVTAPLSVTGGNLTIDLSGYQPIDADLTAIAALTGTNTIYYRSAANTWSAVTVGTGLSFAAGTLANTVSAGASTADVIPHCGRLEYVSSTALSFKPFNGDRIKIAGVLYAIPSAGIAGLGNTGVFVNGVAGQNLAADTVYWVYAVNNAGTITGHFYTSGHTTSTTAGNVGTEIIATNDAYTLIGLIKTGTGGVFVNTAGSRYVISWFNRRTLNMLGATTSGVGTASATAVEIVASARSHFLTWGDEAVIAGLWGTFSAAAIATVGAQIGLDGAATLLWSQGSLGVIPSANQFAPASGVGGILTSEGYHFLTPCGYVISGAATATFYMGISAIIRG